ncbi:MAG: PAS domain-containing protein [Proteobacteria bacterium]|nr:PAS domain-containing protein [Pseudomonadota bacterium]
MFELVEDTASPSAEPAQLAWLDCTAATDRSNWNSKIARFFDYWLGIAPPGRLPGRQHFDPLDIPDVLPHIWLLEVLRLPEGNRFRYRLAGTKEVESLEQEVTGRWFDEVHGAPTGKPATYLRFNHIVANRVATYRKGPVMLIHHRDHQTVENCMVPLARDGATVDMIMACSVLFWQDGKPVGR